MSVHKYFFARPGHQRVYIMLADLTDCKKSPQIPQNCSQSNSSRWSRVARPESACSNIGSLVVMRLVMTYSDVKTIRSLDWSSVQCSNIHEILGFSVCFKINSRVLVLSNPVSGFQQKYFHLFLYISVLSPLNLKKVVSSELFYYTAAQVLLMLGQAEKSP